MKKNILILISILVLGTATVYAAPYSRLERTLLPELSNLFDLGTSTQPWRDFYITRICLTGDTCRTTWPTGGGGSGGGTMSTSTTPVAGVLVNYPNNTTDILCVGGNSTSTCGFFFDPNLYTARIGKGVAPQLTGFGTGYSSLLIATSSNDVNAVNIFNTSTGSQSASGLFFNNANTPQNGIGLAATYYGGLVYGGSGWNGVSNGLGALNKNDLALYVTDGDLIVGSATSSASGNVGNVKFYTGAGSFTGGTPDAILNYQGNLGIGTSSPYAKLAVVGEAVARNFTATSTTVNSTFASKVGIGTTSPAQSLDVAGNGVFTSSIGIRRSDTGSTVGTLSVTSNGLNIDSSNSNSRIIFSIGGTEKARFSGSNFGIGTTSPYATLSVVGETVSRNFTATSTTATSTFAGKLSIQDNTSYATTSSFAVMPTTAARNDIDTNIGYYFTVDYPINVTQLGRLYVAGNSQNHSIQIWDNASTASPLTSGTILAASGSDSNGFKWVNVAPITLVPTKTYTIGIVETNGGDTWKDSWYTINGINNIPSIAEPLKVGGVAFVLSASATFPSTQVADTYGLATIFNTPAIGFTPVGASQLSSFRAYGTTTDSSGYAAVFGNPTNDNTVVIRNDGKTGIGTSSPGAKFSVNGSQLVTGTSTLNLVNPRTYTNKKFVIEGDSISDPGGVGNLPAKDTWTKVMTGLSNNPLYGIGQFGEASYFNFAVAGATASLMVTQYATEAHLVAPVGTNDQGYFFLFAGTNDIWTGTSAATTYGYLQSLWASARADGYKVVAFTVMPRTDNSGAAEIERVALNKLIMADPTLYDYLIRPDVYFSNASDTAYFQSDGVHLTLLASRLLANNILMSVTKNAFSFTSGVSTSTQSGMSAFFNGGGNVGIGTTSPYARLSVVGASGVVADKYTATSTTATSTFAAGLQATYLNLTGATATSTAAKGLNLTGGCFSINNVCIGGAAGTGTVTSVATDATLTGGPITTTGTLGLNLTNPNTWTGLQIFSRASTTLLSSNGSDLFNFLRIPTSTNPSLTVTGDVAVNTTAASSSIAFNDGVEKSFLYPYITKSPYFATSTLGGIIVPGGATTTIEGMMYIPQKMRLDKVICKSYGADFQLQIGTSTPTGLTTMIVRQATTTFTSFASNIFQAGEPMYYFVNATSTAWKKAPCTTLYKYI